MHRRSQRNMFATYIITGALDMKHLYQNVAQVGQLWRVHIESTRNHKKRTQYTASARTGAMQIN